MLHQMRLYFKIEDFSGFICELTLVSESPNSILISVSLFSLKVELIIVDSNSGLLFFLRNKTFKATEKFDFTKYFTYISLKVDYYLI